MSDQTRKKRLTAYVCIGIATACLAEVQGIKISLEDLSHREGSTLPRHKIFIKDVISYTAVSCFYGLAWPIGLPLLAFEVWKDNIM